MVLHDLHLALRYADQAIAMGRDARLAGAAREVLTRTVLSPLFGHPSS